jgi:capsular polysaccharide biosynthesis protein
VAPVRFDADPVPAEGDFGPDSTVVKEGGRHMVSLRFLRSALRRRRRLWVGLALFGLVGGAAYHLVVPITYTATTTLFVADTPGANQTAASANDLAMLNSPSVGRRAAALLGEPSLSPSKLLGKAPGTAVSDNVIDVTISGSSPVQAEQRANAVAVAYLAFRAEAYQTQSDSVVQAAETQINQLQSKIQSLTAQIAAAGTNGQGPNGAGLATQRAAATAQLIGLQQSVQTEKFDAITIAKGSKVITAATAGSTSRKKELIADGLMGLLVGLALGLAIVVLQAVLSDRLRRREDVAAVLGIPVALSIGPMGRRRLRLRRSPRSLAAAPDQGMLTLVRFLRSHLAGREGRPGEMVVAVDDPGIPAAALVALARTMAAAGKRVALMDATNDRAMARVLGLQGDGPRVVSFPGCAPITWHCVPRPWESERQGVDGRDRAALAEAEVVLALATVDPSVGAWHLPTWGSEVVVTVTAGGATAQRIGSVAELLGAAGIAVASAALLNADPDDVSVGLPGPGDRPAHRSLGRVEPDAALLA